MAAGQGCNCGGSWQAETGGRAEQGRLRTRGGTAKPRLFEPSPAQPQAHQLLLRQLVQGADGGDRHQGLRAGAAVGGQAGRQARLHGGPRIGAGGTCCTALGACRCPGACMPLPHVAAQARQPTKPTHKRAQARLAGGRVAGGDLRGEAHVVDDSSALAVQVQHVAGPAAERGWKVPQASLLMQRAAGRQAMCTGHGAGRGARNRRMETAKRR